MSEGNVPDPKTAHTPPPDRPAPDSLPRDSETAAPSRPTPDPSTDTGGRRSQTSGDGKTAGSRDQDPDSAFSDVDRDDAIDVP
jgi:hypothetical protein